MVGRLESNFIVSNTLWSLGFFFVPYLISTNPLEVEVEDKEKNNELEHCTQDYDSEHIIIKIKFITETN